MSDNKKYYYLKLKDDFFDSDEIKVLESMENGYKYSNILLKMYLKSIRREGLLIFNERIPYNPKMIATVTGHNINDVKQALVLFQEMGLMETLSNGAIYMLDIQNFIGKSTTEADRIRAYRNKIEEKKKSLLEGDKVPLSGFCTNVQDKTYKCTPEIEIEIEREIELERETKTDGPSSLLEKTSKDDFKKIARLYQQVIGQPNGLTVDWINSVLEEYGFEWVKSAMEESDRRGKRNRAYIDGVLANWKNEGGIKKGGEHGKGNAGVSKQSGKNEDTDWAKRAGVDSF